MINYFIYDENGHIYRSGTNTKDCVDLIAAEEHGTVRYHHEPLPMDKYYWDGGLVPYPPKPDQWAEFDYVTKQWVSNADTARADARAKRAKLLTACDWTQVSDAPVNKAAWKAYRQSLRDVTEQPGFPFEIIWPTAPK